MDNNYNELAHPYDTIFKELFQKLSDKVIIDFINHHFGNNHPLDCKVRRLSTHTIKDDGLEIINDVILGIEDIEYHIEAQSTYNKNMVLRMFEYGFQSAKNSAKWDNDIVVLDFPVPVVWYLSADDKAREPKKLILKFPDGTESPPYAVKEKYISEYKTPEDMSKHHMHMMLPFHLSHVKTAGAQTVIDHLQQMETTAEKVFDKDDLHVVKIAIVRAFDNIVIPNTDLSEEDIDMIKHRSLYNEAIQEGMQLGVVKGIQEGRQEGKLEEKADVLVRMLAGGFKYSDVKLVTNMPINQIDEFHRENYDYIQSLADKMKAESQGEDEDDEDMEL